VLARLIRVLPTGTLAVGAGLAVLGGASYVHLAIAGHALAAGDMSSLSVLWSIVFSVGLGLFFPIEQEITRVVAARRVAGDGAAPVYARGALFAIGLLALVGLALLLFSAPIADRLFNGDAALVAVLGGGLAGLAIAHPTRGVLAGTGRFGAYGLQLGLDGGLRIILAAWFGLAGVHSPVAFGLILTIAPILAVLATIAPVRANAAPGSRLPWPALLRGLGLLITSTLLAQVVVNIAVINVKLFAPSQTALAGALLGALVLARVPLFVFASLQASLLPGLTTAVAAGDRMGFRRLLVRACGIVTALAILGGVPTVLLGPWLVRTLFNAPDVLTVGDFALLALGTWLYLLAMVLGQAVLALGRHRAQTLGWLAGTAALLLLTAVAGGQVKLRVELAYLGGSAVAALTLALLLVRGREGAVRPAEEPSPALLTGAID
jgi:O-antigen/teichoic acid export membrane protein